MLDLEIPVTAADSACLPAMGPHARPRRFGTGKKSRAALLRQARQPVERALGRLGPLLGETLASADNEERGQLMTLATVLDGLAREIGTRFEISDETLLPILESGLPIPMPDLVEALDEQAAEIHGQLRRVRTLANGYRLDPARVHLAELWATLCGLEHDLECLLAAEQTVHADLALH